MNTRPTPPTMRDVAALAGVHPSTVSRVLRGDTSRVSRPTAQRVRDIADHLRYHPHPSAVSLRSGNTRAIGVLVPRITDVVLASTFEAIEVAATRLGYQALVASTWDSPRERKRRIDLYLSHRIDGLIIADARLSTPQLRTLARRNVPFVLVSRRCKDWPCVSGDDSAGGALVAEHLVERGHQSIGIIAGPPYASTAVDRVQGFRSELSRRAITLHEDLVVPSGFDVDSGKNAMRTILDRGMPTAVFAVNDYAAIGAIGEIADHGLIPGKDIAIVGYNDISIASHLTLPLSSVQGHADDSGRMAVDSLLKLMETGQTDSIRLSPTMVIRDSSSSAWIHH